MDAFNPNGRLRVDLPTTRRMTTTAARALSKLEVRILGSTIAWGLVIDHIRISKFSNQ